jgi:N-acetylgalactosamine kinase
LPPSYQDIIKKNLDTHRPPQKYNIRGILIFGIAEIARSKKCLSILRQGEIEEFGKMMKISHNGDRVVWTDGRDVLRKCKDPYDNFYLEKLISDLASENPERVLNAQLWKQPGSYGCSTSEIDRMVDIVSSVNSLAGAQIAGAGLGGCIMILAKKDGIKQMKKQLKDKYYMPRNLDPEIISCITVKGACLAQF